MNYSSEPDPNFEGAFVITQHVCGIIMLGFNSFVILLIVFDDDSRNKHYRKYLCFVQSSSMAFDTFFEFYSPIVLIHKGLVYSDSFLSNWISMGVFLSVEVVLLIQVVFSYFACVYYRRSYVIDSERFLNYKGRDRIILLLLMQFYVICVGFGTIYFMRKSVQAAEDFLPTKLHWVRQRQSYVYMRPDVNVTYSACVSYPAGTIFVIIIIVMLKQLVNEVKRGVRKTSIATRRYQLLAVRSLILQGAVPSLVYLVPSQGNTFLQFAPSIFECGEQFNRFGNYLSPILWFIMTKHTFVSSLTILYCSPSYRKKIWRMLRRERVVTPQRLSLSSKESTQMWSS